MNKNTFTAMNLGVAYMRANKLDEAVEMFNTSKELDKRGENKDLAENIEAIKQHLNYRTKQRSAAKHKQDKTAAVNAILAGGSD
jgi:CHASE3 domain sensor protein